MEGLLNASIWVDIYGLIRIKFVNDALYGFKGFERTLPIDILTLMVGSFGVDAQIML